MAGVVVGVDGSRPARAALAWGRDEAGRRGTTLSVIFAYVPPGPWMGVGEAMGGTTTGLPSDEEMTGSARAELDRILTELGDAPGAASVESRVVTGDPATCLIEASRGAELLVVGRGGHGGLAHAFLGSVSSHCVAHAHCPVVVVPADGGS
jgi:nucleotide-binding universal stress UspA family protein